MIELHPARPDDAFIDELDLGDGQFAGEAVAFFRSRRWFRVDQKKEQDKRKPPTFVVVSTVGGAPTSIGMVAMTRRRVAPAIGGEAPRLALSIEVMGIHRPFQGRRADTDGRPTLAVLLMEHLRDHAIAIGCRGVALLVRAENTKAVAYYRKCGFEIIERLNPEGHLPTLRMVRWCDGD